MDLVIHAATPAHLPSINIVIEAAKRTWAYDPAYLERAMPLLRVDAGYLALNACFEAWLGPDLVGFAAVEWGLEVMAIVDHLWVVPGHQGHGVGRCLLRRCAEEAAARGVGVLRIVSDPPAEGFYLRLGAVRVGEKPSRIPGGPRFPVLDLQVPGRHMDIG